MTDETLFAVALEQRTPDERAQYLAESCPDPEQRARLESLLAAHDRAGRFLDRPPLVADSVTRSFGPPDDTRPAEAPADEADDALSFLAPPTRPDSLGRLGQYEVLEVLGRGGFGVVFRAFDDRLQRVVAVKVLAPQVAATSPARKRFLREARSTAAVRHENVVQVHAVEEQPLPHLVMEYIPGETLQQRLDRTGPLDVAEVLRTGRQIAAGLAAAHAQGLIHRDIKPSNILLDAGPHPTVKITDFGLARAADDASLTRSGAVAGTPMYMAPEQAEGKALDHRADLFSLGSVLYALLTGRPPFRANSTLAVLKRVADDTPRPIREVIPEVPEWLCRIVEKLHAKNPADRFQTAREVADLLADCEKQLAERKELTDFTRIPAGQPVKKPRRWRWAVLAAAVLLLAGLAAALFWRPISLFATNSGELVLDDADPTFQVTVRQGGRVVRDGSTQREFVLPADDATELQFRSVTGTDLFRTDVRVPRGGRVRVNVAEELAAVEQRHRDAAANNLKELGEAVNRYGDGFTPLFNGKDLSGWKTHPDLPGNWVVRDGILTGNTAQSCLFTVRGDFGNFHLRAEVRINTGGDSGIRFRVPFAVRQWDEVWPLVGPGGGYEADISALAEARAAAGSVWGWSPGGVLSRAPAGLTRPDEWFTLEVIADGNRFVTKVNGQEAAGGADPLDRDRAGHLALLIQNPRTVVEFRTIEIKELPPSVSAVPKTAADVLPYLAGSWKGEMESTGPQLPPGETVTAGELTFDFVAGTKFLRQRGGPANEFGQPHFLYSFDPAQGLRRWVAWSAGATAGPVVGTFNPDSRTLLWMHNIAAGPYNVEMHFADGDTIKVRSFRLDPGGKITRESRLVFTRLKRPAAPTLLPPDPKRPPEMAVLDRMIGEWRNEQTVTAAAEPDRAKAETARVTARSILGGRFVEEQVTNETTGESDYALAWFDPTAKAYRRWDFSSGGSVTEMTGTWDAATSTLNWETADKSKSGRWVFKGDDRREFRHTVNDKDGKPVVEMTGVSSRRPVTSKAEAGERAKEVAALEKARDEAKLRFDAGKENKLHLLAAEVALTEARVKLAEAEGNPKGVVTQLEALVAHRQEERELIAGRVEAEVEPRGALDAANARLADAKARLAKVRPPKGGPEPQEGPPR